jgi:signal recognition particle subunit SRP54
MVLESLGMQISQSLAGLSQVSVIDEEVLNNVLKDIARALLTADVNFRIVGQMRDNIRKRVNVEKLAAGLNKEKIIHQAVNDELVAILDGESEDGKGPKGEHRTPLTLTPSLPSKSRLM